LTPSYSEVGLSRQSVNKALRRLIDEGALSSSYGKVTVVDPGKLRDLASDR
jgi:DNA-binding GntR family transcriptional regulator